MSEIVLTFACGHQKSVTGGDTEWPRCSCGESRIDRVDAPPPRFKGTATGPCATFENLDAKPVTFEGTKPNAD